MAQMLDDCTYDKVKVLAELSSILWFIKKHALKEGDTECKTYFEKLEKDLEKYVVELKNIVCK